MAINFPSTAGQPTNGSYTYTVAGITYSWDGSSWAAAGAGASATDRTLFSVNTTTAGTAALSYNNNNELIFYLWICKRSSCMFYVCLIYYCNYSL